MEMPRSKTVLGMKKSLKGLSEDQMWEKKSLWHLIKSRRKTWKGSVKGQHWRAWISRMSDGRKSWAFWRNNGRKTPKCNQNFKLQIQELQQTPRGICIKTATSRYATVGLLKIIIKRNLKRNQRIKDMLHPKIKDNNGILASQQSM